MFSVHTSSFDREKLAPTLNLFVNTVFPINVTDHSQHFTWHLYWKSIAFPDSGGGSNNFCLFIIADWQSCLKCYDRLQKG